MTAPSATAEHDPAARGSALLFWAQLAGNSGLFVALVLISRALDLVRIANQRDVPVLALRVKKSGPALRRGRHAIHVV